LRRLLVVYDILTTQQWL